LPPPNRSKTSELLTANLNVFTSWRPTYFASASLITASRVFPIYYLAWKDYAIGSTTSPSSNGLYIIEDLGALVSLFFKVVAAGLAVRGREGVVGSAFVF
jgi:hypothetical protein